MNDTGTAIVNKTFSFNDIPQYVFTFYLKGGQGLFAFDFWADADVASEYNPGYVEIANSINFDGTKAVDFALYNYVYTHSDPNGLFEFEVPRAGSMATMKRTMFISIHSRPLTFIVRLKTLLMMMGQPGQNHRPELLR